MKNKLHTTLCHPNMSLRAKSRSRQLIPKSHSIFYVLCSILYSLFSISATAQYNWDWGLTGGGSTGEIGWDYQTEQIFDIAIDKNNNYYFLAKIKNGNPQLNGQPVTVYGNPQGGNDIFLFSTTSNGTVRWSQAIGGGGAV